MLFHVLLLSVAAATVPHFAAEAASCSTNEDCLALQDSQCVESECVCPDEYFANNEYTRCLAPAEEGYGASCEAATQCASRMGLGLYCDGSCACADGYHYLHGVCRQSSGLGETCAEDADCFDNHASYTLRCSAESVCECADGAYQWNGVCRLSAVEVGDSCFMDSDCSAAGADLLCINNICSAGEETASRMTDEVEEQRDASFKPRSGAVCSAETPCGTNEYCALLGTCVCALGYFRDSDDVCKLELGEACASDADCAHISDARCGVTDSASGQSVCHCGPRWAPDPANNFCRLGRKMDYSCAVDANCFNFGNGGICQDYKCACAEGTYFVEEEQFCWPAKALGEACSSELDCYYDGGSCGDDAICACAEGYHQTEESTCFKDVTALGDSCLSDSDCSILDEHAVCDQESNGTCGCDENYLQTADTTCRPGIGGPCSQQEDCAAVQDSICNETCACPNGTVVNSAGSACLQEALDEGGSCAEVTQCQTALGSNSSCVDGQCRCAEGTHFLEGNCWTTAYLGDSCTNALECMSTSDNAVVCRNGQCELRDFTSGTSLRLLTPALLVAPLLTIRVLL